MRRPFVLALLGALSCCRPTACREPPPPTEDVDDLQPAHQPSLGWELRPHSIAALPSDGGQPDAGLLDAGLDAGRDGGWGLDAGRGVSPSGSASPEDEEDEEDEDEPTVDAGHGCGTDGGIVTCTEECWCSAPSFDASGSLLAVSSGGSETWALGSTLLHFDGRDWEEVATGRRLFGTLSDAFAGTRRPRIQGNALWVSSADDVWIARGTRFTHWDGRQFSNPGSSAGLLNPVSAIWAASPTDLWAVGQAGTLVHGDGTSWSATASGTTESLTSVWGSGPHDVWAVGTNGFVLHYNGSTWEPIDSGTDAWMNGVWVAPSGEVWIASNTGVLRGGRSGFHPVDLGTDVALFAIWGDSAGTVWAGGSLGTLLRFDNRGWRTVQSGTRVSLRGVGGGAGQVYAVGDSGVLLWHSE